MYNDASSYKKPISMQCNRVKTGMTSVGRVYEHTKLSQASIMLMKLTRNGAASSRRDEGKIAGEVGTTWLLAGGSCNKFPDADYSTFKLFGEGDTVVSDSPWHLGVVE
ncbi:hypothetical protein BYT27DRAFT_7198933 [Phlegmacium glaucopus]|nr:hypothetical protein BYT27DRAFT_7198933 [Phlegmacium glaucopus]